jgi:hypothetical protein
MERKLFITLFDEASAVNKKYDLIKVAAVRTPFRKINISDREDSGKSVGKAKVRRNLKYKTIVAEIQLNKDHKLYSDLINFPRSNYKFGFGGDIKRSENDGMRTIIKKLKIKELYIQETNEEEKEL